MIPDRKRISSSCLVLEQLHDYIWVTSLSVCVCICVMTVSSAAATYTHPWLNLRQADSASLSASYHVMSCLFTAALLISSLTLANTSSGIQHTGWEEAPWVDNTAEILDTLRREVIDGRSLMEICTSTGEGTFIRGGFSLRLALLLCHSWSFLKPGRARPSKSHLGIHGFTWRSRSVVCKRRQWIPWSHSSAGFISPHLSHRAAG